MLLEINGGINEQCLQWVPCIPGTTLVGRGKCGVRSNVSLNQMEKLQPALSSGYKGGGILNLEFPLCLVLGSSGGGGE